MGYLRVEVGALDHLQEELGNFFDDHFDVVSTLVPYLANDLSPADLEGIGSPDSLDEWLREIDERMIDQAVDLWKFIGSLKGSEVLSENEAEIGSLESASSFYFSEIADEVMEV